MSQNNSPGKPIAFDIEIEGKQPDAVTPVRKRLEEAANQKKKEVATFEDITEKMSQAEQKRIEKMKEVKERTQAHNMKVDQTQTQHAKEFAARTETMKAHLEEKLGKASAKRDSNIEKIKQTAVECRVRRSSSNNLAEVNDAPSGCNQ